MIFRRITAGISLNSIFRVMSTAKREVLSSDGDYKPDNRDKYINMSIEEKRKKYRCGDTFVKLDGIETIKQNGYLLKKLRGDVSDADRIKPIKDKEEANRLSELISLWAGDITKLEIDAIVNAANKTLLGGGGVDGAIHKSAGPLLLAECRELKGCQTGEAKITAGYNLPAKYVIHTVGPIGRGDKDLEQCYSNSLKVARTNNLKSIGFPCISTGVYGFPNEPAARIAIATVLEFLQSPEGKDMERVIFVTFLEKDLKIYANYLNKYLNVI